jgi:hypothetical protein
MGPPDAVNAMLSTRHVSVPARIHYPPETGENRSVIHGLSIR